MQKQAAVDLKHIPVFHDVPLASLEWFLAKSEIRHMAAGETVFSKGQPSENLLVVLSGSMRISRDGGAGLGDFIQVEKDSVTGLLPFSRMVKSMGTGTVEKEGDILFFNRINMREMIRDHYELTEALVHQMSTRIREMTSLQELGEKMMALGKLSAGLAHELNNPAAAIARSSSILCSTLQQFPARFGGILGLGLTAGTAEQLMKHLGEKLQAQGSENAPGPLERARREDEILARLEKMGVENSDTIAADLLEFAYTDDEIVYLENLLHGHGCSAVFDWLSGLLSAERLAAEISEAGKRISDLVGSVKVFTHMDRSNAMQLSNVHEGLKNTLTMLSFRLKKGKVELITDFDESLPKINLFVGEMNQVWTNLIDNALDAMEQQGQGELVVKTSKDGNSIRTSIQDSGTGIPEEIKKQVFDPFFTTKEIGKGTGLGLESAAGIVRRHKGSINFKSVPGKTEFIVCIPIEQTPST